MPATTIVFTGERQDLVLRPGWSLTPIEVSDFVDEDGDPVTSISDAWFTVRAGTVDAPGAVVSAITITPTISPASPNGEAVTITITEADIDELTVGSAYCYEFGVTFGSSQDQAIFEGQIYVYPRLRAPAP